MLILCLNAERFKVEKNKAFYIIDVTFNFFFASF